jgi:hypothetical protein
MNSDANNDTPWFERSFSLNAGFIGENPRSSAANCRL